MISILIPVYNYNIEPLIKVLCDQVSDTNINYEIIVIDDASTSIKYQKQHLLNYKNLSLIQLDKNIGRSAIRNLLASKANYENCLFIDAGNLPKSKSFINSYLDNLNNEVVIGGMVEAEQKPKKPYRLRWLFTKKRERFSNDKVCSSANFMIKKQIINKYPFDESVQQYGYEDLFFFNTLKDNSVDLHFIDNPVIHDCGEDAFVFMRKIEQGLENLAEFSIKNYDLIKDNNIVTLYERIHHYRLDFLIKSLFKLTRGLILKNLNSSYPSILLFDFYRLGYFCTMKQKQ
jgi:glycosyltransferase involved in cell wall biosynthesis